MECFPTEAQHSQGICFRIVLPSRLSMLSAITTRICEILFEFLFVKKMEILFSFFRKEHYESYECYEWHMYFPYTVLSIKKETKKCYDSSTWNFLDMVNNLFKLMRDRFWWETGLDIGRQQDERRSDFSFKSERVNVTDNELDISGYKMTSYQAIQMKFCQPRLHFIRYHIPHDFKNPTVISRISAIKTN